MLPERYVPKRISDISEKDRKVSILGRVVGIDLENKTLILDDDTGKIELYYTDQGSVTDKDVEGRKGETVRAFCILVGKKLHMDILQPLGELDLNLSKTVDELYSKAGV